MGSCQLPSPSAPRLSHEQRDVVALLEPSHKLNDMDFKLHQHGYSPNVQFAISNIGAKGPSLIPHLQVTSSILILFDRILFSRGNTLSLQEYRFCALKFEFPPIISL